MKCPYCGEMLADGSQFCARCGNRLVSAAAVAGAPGGVGAPGAGYAPTVEQTTSGKAIASLIMGILVFIPFSAVAAIILGHLALSEIKKNAGRLKGQGLAMAGLILGYSEIVMIPLILIIAAIAIPNLLRAKMAANEASSVSAMRTYSMAIVSYAEKCPQQGYPDSTVKLGPGAGDCDSANLIDRVLAGPMPSKSGYVFHYEPGATDATGKVTSYTITADPIQQNTTGIRHFFLDESGVIRVESGRAASAESIPLR
jgi:type II secretory pathway pseudopilin PulG